MRTVICIPASGFPHFSSPDPDNRPEEPVPEREDPVDVYEKPYQILFDGITEALRLLRAERYGEARACLMDAQIRADEAVTE